MSFAVTADAGRFEWNGGGINWRKTAAGLFAQPSNLLSPSYLWMLRDILTFNQQSIEDYSAGPLLAATFHGCRRDLSAAQLLRSFFALPLVTLKIVAAIRWEALRLWIKGARLVPRSIPATGRPQRRL
jgi:uncharacterized protein